MLSLGMVALLGIVMLNLFNIKLVKNKYNIKQIGENLKLCRM